MANLKKFFFIAMVFLWNSQETHAQDPILNYRNIDRIVIRDAGEMKMALKKINEILSINANTNPKPWATMDGKRIDYGNLISLELGKIDVLEIFKPQLAIKNLGIKAKNGAILITSKKIADSLRYSAISFKFDAPMSPDRFNYDKTVYDTKSVNIQPTYPGGMDKFYKLVNANMKYPQVALENKISGTVILSFVVERDGLISSIKIDKKVGFEIDEEAIRLLKLARRWNPGIKNEKPVYVKQRVSIPFSLPQ